MTLQSALCCRMQNFKLLRFTKFNQYNLGRSEYILSSCIVAHCCQCVLICCCFSFCRSRSNGLVFTGPSQLHWRGSSCVSFTFWRTAIRLRNSFTRDSRSVETVAKFTRHERPLETYIFWCIPTCYTRMCMYFVFKGSRRFRIEKV